MANVTLYAPFETGTVQAADGNIYAVRSGRVTVPEVNVSGLESSGYVAVPTSEIVGAGATGAKGDKGDDGDATAYSPDAAGDWVAAPSTIAAALDELAARVQALDDAGGGE